MRRVCVSLLIAMLAVPAFAATEPKTDDQKTLYALGLAVARQLAPFTLTQSELEFVQQGIADGVTGKKPVVELEQYGKKVQELGNARMKAESEKLAAAGKEVMEKAAKEKGAVKTESGLIYQPIKEGTGASPSATDTVKVNYRGTLVDGREFDSSYKRNEPAEFPLSGVIKCWSEGLQKMKVGGKAKLICPPSIAYGERSTGIIPPNATLIFEVELLDILKK